jgi:hypothetical protein
MIFGCFSSVDKAKKYIKTSTILHDKWYIIENILNAPVENTHNIVCDYKTRPDKYFYNPSSHYVLCPIYVIYDKEKSVISGCYSDHDIAKNIVQGNNNFSMIKHNLDESVKSMYFLDA